MRWLRCHRMATTAAPHAAPMARLVAPMPRQHSTQTRQACTQRCEREGSSKMAPRGRRLHVMCVLSSSCLASADTKRPMPAAKLDDREKECAGWAGQGECEKNPQFMRSSCALSCCKKTPRHCPPDMELATTEWCDKWGASGICSNEETLMRRLCPSHCCQCAGRDPEAADGCAETCCAEAPVFCAERFRSAPSVELCSKWVERGACTRFLEYMLRTPACRDSCVHHYLLIDDGDATHNGRAECLTSASPEACINDYVYTAAGWEQLGAS